uniref:Uncharacterized protein n=1 Tax=Arundo donax TaxID=35708 RepID=A0A0A9BBZ7_ARUDO
MVLCTILNKRGFKHLLP